MGFPGRLASRSGPFSGEIFLLIKFLEFTPIARIK